MIKYIVGGVVVVLAWVITLLIGFPKIIPFLVTLVVALVLLLVVGIEKLKERRAARQLEQALQAQAAQDAANARPDLAHDIAEMQAEFQKAVAALKTSKKGGKKALYALPWYAIIGPPGCGKSTALRNSGLQFPYLSASGGGVRGLGGTRNCDWWMTSEAVILDTAGRWTSEEEDHEEWLGFLDLIKKFRPKKPLNGLITAVSVGDVGGAREDEVVALALRIRERIDEVQGSLGMSLPIYVLFTKCDLIPGFVETFGDMSKQDRGQVWGYTAPLTKKIAPPGEYFQKGFDELMDALMKRAVKRMGEERKIANREMIYAFPQQLSVLKANLQEFVHHLFQENVFKETPLPRGVYFTSGTQEGRPIDRVMSAMAEAFGQPQVQLPAAQVESKSYFLRDTFANVVFLDAEVAARSPVEMKRQRNRTIAAAALIFVLAIGMTLIPGISFAMNRSYLSGTREMIDTVRETVAGDSEEVIPANDIEPLRARTIELESYDDDGAPVLMQMGMYPDEVFAPVHDTYLSALRRRVVEPLMRAEENTMGGFASRTAALGPTAVPDAVEMRDAYESLKLYLLLTVPRDEHQPALDDSLREFIGTQLRTRWREATETPRHDPQMQMIEDNVEHYVDALSSHSDLFLPRNEQVVAGLRQIFAASQGPRMAVQGIIAEMDERNCDIRFAQLIGGPAGPMYTRSIVRCAFTKRGWDDRVEHILDHEADRFFGERWVLGIEPPESARHEEVERETRVAELKAYFLEQYVEEWRTFIDSIVVTPSTTNEEHMRLLTVYTSGQPMLMTRLIRQVDYNITLVDPGSTEGGGLNTDAASAAARRRLAARIGARGGIGTGNARRLIGIGEDRAGQAVDDAMNPGGLPPDVMTPRRVREQFRGFLAFAPASPADVPAGQTAQVDPARQYEEQIEYLRDALGFRMDGTNVTNYDERQATAQTLSERLISEMETDWRARFTSLMLPPILGSEYVVPGAPTTPTPTPTPTPTEGAAAPDGGEAATPTEDPPPRRRRRGGWWR